jgi:hypothetical protein
LFQVFDQFLVGEHDCRTQFWKTIPSKFGSNWATGSRQDGFYVNFP